MKSPFFSASWICLFLSLGAVVSRASNVEATATGNWIKLDITSDEKGEAFPKRLIFIPMKSIASVRVLERGGAISNSDGKGVKEAGEATLVINVSSDTCRDTNELDVTVEHLTGDQARNIAEKLLTLMGQTADTPSESR